MSSSDGQGIAAIAARRDPGLDDRPLPGKTGFGDESAELDEIEKKAAAEADAVRAAAREIAARLALTVPRVRRPRSRGAGELLTLPYSGSADEIDLDRTLDAIAERRPLQAEDIVVRERRRRRRAVVLAVDVSGSMKGERLRTAAATVGALTAELAHDDLAVIAFWSDAAILLRLGEYATLEALVDELLAIRASGLTNVSFPLEVAEQELRRIGDRRRQVLLLSDCVHNAGPDPRLVAARLPRLDVLLDVSGEQDPNVARDLARLGRGLALPVSGPSEVAPALSRVLAG